MKHRFPFLYFYIASTVALMAAVMIWGSVHRQITVISTVPQVEASEPEAMDPPESRCFDLIRNSNFDYIRSSKINGKITYEVIVARSMPSVLKGASELSMQLKQIWNEYGEDLSVTVMVLFNGNREVVDLAVIDGVEIFRR